MDTSDESDGPTPSENNEFWTAAEAAAYLGVDRRSVIRYIQAGIAGPGGQRIMLPAETVASRHGQEWKVRRSDVETFNQARSLTVQERRPVSSAGIASGAQLVAGELEMERQHHDLELALAYIKEQSREIEHLAIERGELAGENAMLRAQLEDMKRKQAQGLLRRLVRFLFGG